MEDDDSVFTTPIPIGEFIILVTLVVDVLVWPLFELLKNCFTNAITISRIASARQVVLRGDRVLSCIFGVSDSIKNNTFPLRLAYFFKLSFKALIISMIAYWEFTANEVEVAKLSLQELALGRERPTGIRLLSPMPFTGLEEGNIIRMVTFKVYGVEQNGPYVVLNGDDYAFAGDDQCSDLSEGRLSIYLSRAEIFSNRTITKTCLDGTQKRPQHILAALDIRPSDQITYDLVTIQFEQLIATDGTSAIYRISTEHDGNPLKGYAALTARTHQHGNSFWSLYGLLHNQKSDTLEYINIPLSGDGDRPCLEDEIGIWQLQRPNNDSEQTITCPNTITFRAPSSTRSPNVIAANWTVRPDVEADKLALQWVAETPFSDYVAKTKLAEEVWGRLHRQVYFLSDFKKSIELPEIETAKVTQTSRHRTIVTSATLSALLAFLLLSSLVEWVQKKRHNIHVNFCDVGTVLGMWNSEVYGAPTCAVSSTEVAVGLSQNETVQHLGTVMRGEDVTTQGAADFEVQKESGGPRLTHRIRDQKLE